MWRGGDQGGHVETGANLRATAADVALTTESPAVVVEWGDASQRGGLGIGERPQLGHERDQGRGGDVPDSLNLLQALELGREVLGFGDLVGDERVDLFDLLLQVRNRSRHDDQDRLVDGGVREVGVLSDLSQEMNAKAD